MLFSSNVYCQSDSQQSSKVGSSDNPLTGGVILEEQLLPLNQSMKVGNKFVPKAIGLENPSNQWCLIPKWLAGKWHMQKAVWPALASDIVINNPPLPDKIFGYQQDKNGDIWDFIGTPQMENHLDIYFLGFWNKFKKSYFVTSDIRIIRCDSEQLICRRTSLELKTQNDIILKSNQLQVYETWKPSLQGIVNNQILRLYSSSGRKIKTDQNDCFYQLVLPFVPINSSDNGVDYHQLFIDYLKSTNRTFLIPD